MEQREEEGGEEEGHQTKRKRKTETLCKCQRSLSTHFCPCQCRKPCGIRFIQKVKAKQDDDCCFRQQQTSSPYSGYSVWAGGLLHGSVCMYKFSLSDRAWAACWDYIKLWQTHENVKRKMKDCHLVVMLKITSRCTNTTEELRNRFRCCLASIFIWEHSRDFFFFYFGASVWKQNKKVLFLSVSVILIFDGCG